MDAAVGILEPYELRFSDLVLLSSEKVESSSSSEEIGRLESVMRAVMESLGPTGPGLLSITGVPPNATSNLRRTLLPLARKLALIGPDDRKRILKEHSLGSDVPLKNLDRLVSSFAMQLKYINGIGNTKLGASHERDGVETWRESQDSKFSSLQSSFKELGFCMMELGLRLARVCDRAIGGQELEQSLLESCTAKGRLIHYHSDLDNLILKEGVKRKESTKRRENKFQTHTSENDDRSCGNDSILWQQWHYDYGIFTVLTDPMFILPCSSQSDKLNRCFCKSCEHECSSPSGHTYLQIFDPSKNRVLTVKTSPESFIVQVGEAADILSKGKLHATLHCVCKPQNRKDLSRETFVVFLQPAWSKTLSLSDYPIKHSLSSGQFSGECTGEACNSEEELNEQAQELSKIVPPLSSRLKEGMTFAEFSRETTKQYYGNRGLQSNR